MSIADSLPYLRPISNLVRFFRGSRDNWKAKYDAVKRENKRLKTRLAKMTENRERWKAQVQSLREGCPAETVPFGEKTTKGVYRRSSGRRGRRA